MKKVKDELKKLGKLSIFIAKRPNQKKMIDLIRKIIFMEKKLVEQKTDKPQKGEFIDLE